jgi:putative sigma-54 modulation protein
MLQKFEVRGVHVDVDDKLKAYINKKIGGLDKYISRHGRTSAHAEVHLKESTKSRTKDHSRCEVTLRLPHQTIVVKESSLNMYAAVDIAEAKLKQQLQKYKELHGGGKLQRHLFGRFRRQNA